MTRLEKARGGLSCCLREPDFKADCQALSRPYAEEESCLRALHADALMLLGELRGEAISRTIQELECEVQRANSAGAEFIDLVSVQTLRKALAILKRQVR